MNTVLVIISINLGVFIAVQISPEAAPGVHQLTLDLGLYSNIDFFLDRPWGIITSMFTHQAFFHLFANMITLFFFGSYLNRLIGSRKLLLVYFGGGLAASAFFILLSSNDMAIGASGAVFALGGALAVMLPRLRVLIFPIPAPIPLWIAALGIFVLLTILPMLNAYSNVAWQAHLGGAIFGLIVGYIFKGKRRYYY